MGGQAPPPGGWIFEKRGGVSGVRMGNFVSGVGEWTLPQHGPHTYMRENRIPDSLQPSAIRFFKIYA